MNGARDRDYVQDCNGNVLRIIGDDHPKDGVLSFVKYFPSEHGCRIVNGIHSGYNSLVCKSKELLGHEKNRVVYSNILGAEVTYTPDSLITRYYSCREKSKFVLSSRQDYLLHPVGKHLIRFLEYASELLTIDEIGITGSFLFNAQTDNSDIDLVCYGRNAYEAFSLLFKNKNLIQRYEDGYQQKILQRRRTQGSEVDSKVLLIQESRKLQGMIKGTTIHINCQPLRNNNETLKNHTIRSLGCVSGTVIILDDQEGRFSPAYYSIRVLSIMACKIDYIEEAKQASVLVSLLGDYAQSFRESDRVYVEGEVVEISCQDKIFYGIELSRWNNSSNHQARLQLHAMRKEEYV